MTSRPNKVRHPRVLLLSLLLVNISCERVTARGTPGGTALPHVEEGTGLLFTFFDPSAQMRTVDRLIDIPAEARRAVMLTSMERHLSNDQVFIADLSTRGKNGQYRVWVEERGAWLDRVMPRASVAKIDPVRKRPRTTARRPKPAARPPRPQPTGGAVTATPPAATAQVVMFSTSWCPSCRLARQFFGEKGVRYVDLDVEKNSEAAERMVAIQKAHGMQIGSVPLIVVGNAAYQGFSRMQLEGALAQL